MSSIVLTSVTVLFSLVVAWFIAEPHFRVSSAGSEGMTDLERRGLVDQERIRNLQALRDIELELSTGKLSESDYREQRTSIVSRLGEIYEQLDQLSEGEDADSERSSGV